MTAAKPPRVAAEHRHVRPRRRRPRDWLAVLGVLFIVAGLGIGGWVVWELFGTTVVAQSEAREQVAEFYAEIPEAGPGVAHLRTDLTADPPPQATPTATGTWATLIVPSWAGEKGPYGEDLSTRIPIAEGIGSDVIDHAWAGHYPGTAGPGEVGNFSLAAHRRSRGQSFARLDQLRAGDSVVVETADTWYVYSVTGDPEVVLPEAVEEVAPVPHEPTATPTRRLITLTTCTSTTLGEWGNDHRLSVHAELTGWAPRSEGVPEELAGAGV
jgi:sortase A